MKLMENAIKQNPGIKFYHGKGCNDCNNTGYSGRKGIFELLRITSKIRDLITQKSSSDVISKSVRVIISP